MEFEFALLEKRLNLSQSLEDSFPVLKRNNLLATQHEDMGSTPPKIVRNEAFITRRNPFDISSGEKFNDLAGGEVLEPSAPELFNLQLVTSFGFCLYLSQEMTPTLITNRWPKQWVSGRSPSGDLKNRFSPPLALSGGPSFRNPSYGAGLIFAQDFDILTATF
jgi:hypothetical protein